MCLDSHFAHFTFCVFFSFFFIFFTHFSFGGQIAWFTHCSQNPQPLYSEKKNLKLKIKNGSHSTIHTFKNYFATTFSVFSFQQNKLYPNEPLVYHNSHQETLNQLIHFSFFAKSKLDAYLDIFCQFECLPTIPLLHSPIQWYTTPLASQLIRQKVEGFSFDVGLQRMRCKRLQGKALGPKRILHKVFNSASNSSLIQKIIRSSQWPYL